MKILIATDAAPPQVNGVVRTYEQLILELRRQGHLVGVISPSDFRTVPCPTYPEIRLALPDMPRMLRIIDDIRPDAIHIATEGPIGWMVRRYCCAQGFPFTTSFHTRFPDYIASRFSVPEAWTYAGLRRFHAPSGGIMVATRSLEEELSAKGFRNLLPWSRGVDTDHFRPRPVRRFGDGPVFLYVGRVAIEKNIRAFLALDLPGRKVVVGDGPLLQGLKAEFSDVTFTGARTGEDLAACYASADVFVFPSRTDTFGMVILEAMASGLPVAAFPVMGPCDLITPGETGVLSEDLQAAALAAVSLDRTTVRRAAMAFGWRAAAQQFLGHVRKASATRISEFVAGDAARSRGQTV